MGVYNDCVTVGHYRYLEAGATGDGQQLPGEAVIPLANVSFVQHLAGGGR